LTKQSAVYILTSNKNNVLYIGVTSDLIKRVWQHKNGSFKGFSKKYNVSKLVYFEQHQSMEEAIVREKQLKYWKRDWKERIIEENNPEWHDLYDQLL
jgi:putative endonuclease